MVYNHGVLRWATSALARRGDRRRRRRRRRMMITYLCGVERRVSRLAAKVAPWK